MDKEYLQKLEADRSQILDGTKETFGILEGKAKYVASAFVTVAAAILGYSLTSFSNILIWQQAFLVGLSPCFVICFLKLIEALRARSYRTGITYPIQRDANIESYLVWRSEGLLDAIKKNRDSNAAKAMSINSAFVALVISAPVGIVCALVGASFLIYRDNLWGWLNDFWLLFLILLLSSIISLIFVRHFSSLLNSSSCEELDDDGARVESTANEHE